jgi:hypothetical protein
VGVFDAEFIFKQEVIKQIDVVFGKETVKRVTDLTLRLRVGDSVEIA